MQSYLIRQHYPNIFERFFYALRNGRVLSRHDEVVQMILSPDRWECFVMSW